MEDNDARQKKHGPRAKRHEARITSGRSAGSKYSPANIALWLRQWKEDRENWKFSSIANDEVVRICLNKELMTKDDFDTFVEFWKTNRSYGAYMRLKDLCDQVQKKYAETPDDPTVRAQMKRVVKLLPVMRNPKDPKKKRPAE